MSSDTGNHRRPGYSSDSGSYGHREPTSDSGSHARQELTSDSGSYPWPGRTDYQVPAVYQPADYAVADTQATVAYPRPATGRADLPGDAALPANPAAGPLDYSAPDYSARASTTQYAAAPYTEPTVSGNDYRSLPPVPAAHQDDASTVAYHGPSAASAPTRTGYHASVPATDMPDDSGYQSPAASGSSLPVGAGYLGSASGSAYTDGYTAAQPGSHPAPDPVPGHLGYGSVDHQDSTVSGYLPNLEASLPSPGLPVTSQPAGEYGGQFTGGGYLPQSSQLGSGYGNGFQHSTGASGAGDSYPAGQLHQMPYEPAGFPSPAQQAGGYTETDPYAIDPYGTPRYGHGGY